MVILSFFLAFSGFFFLSISMKRNYKQVWSSAVFSSKKIIIHRAVGVNCLVFSCLISIKEASIGVGLVEWTGLLTFAALLQSMLLTYGYKLVSKFK